MMIREIVSIDEDLCDGCGNCVPSCAEGAIRVIQGKARIVSDVLCDGLGACLGDCPLGAIKIERREAVAFDEDAVHKHLPDPDRTPDAIRPPSVPDKTQRPLTASPPARHNGCPSARLVQFERVAPAPDSRPGPEGDSPGAETPSHLTHWPVQLRLLPAAAPFLRGARLLVTADCVPVACADFQRELLKDHAVVVACPKLDDTRGYVEKLTDMIRQNDFAEITVARMEVPCCAGILQAVLAARGAAGGDTPVTDVVVAVDGRIIARRRVGTESALA